MLFPTRRRYHIILVELVGNTSQSTLKARIEHRICTYSYKSPIGNSTFYKYNARHERR